MISFWGSNFNQKFDCLTDQPGDNTISYCFTLFIRGGPCHLSSPNSVLETLFSSENSLFIQLWKNRHV